MDCEKNLTKEEKNLSEHLFDLFTICLVFDAKKPKTDHCLQYHCDLIILSDLLKEGRYDQVKQIIDKASEKIAALEMIMGLFD